MNSKKSVGWKVLVLLVLLLFVNLPIVSALEISNIAAEASSPTSAKVSWETDQPANSLVNYGISKQSLAPAGDASAITNHQVQLTGLAANTTYYYKVQSGNVTDDNAGNLYSFNTLAPDKTAPELKVDLPATFAGRSTFSSGAVLSGARVLKEYKFPALSSVTFPL